jgi:hypothetical protein
MYVLVDQIKQVLKIQKYMYVCMYVTFHPPPSHQLFFAVAATISDRFMN